MAKRHAHEAPGLTLRQRREIDALMMQAWAVRGLQAFMTGLGAYLAYCEGRGWIAFAVGLAIAFALQSQLPALPDWAQKLRAQVDE